MKWMILALIAACAFAQEGENVGKRPYELDWAGRMEDDNPPLVDFEDMTGWRVETENAEAIFELTIATMRRYVGSHRQPDPADQAHLVHFCLKGLSGKEIPA